MVVLAFLNIEVGSFLDSYDPVGTKFCFGINSNMCHCRFLCHTFHAKILGYKVLRELIRDSVDSISNTYLMPNGMQTR